MATIDFDFEPSTYKQSLQDSRWRVVMAEEIWAPELNGTSRRTIGVGELQVGFIYYLWGVVASLIVYQTTNNEDIWHQRLGQPSRRIIIEGTDLFLREKLNKCCDICHRTKQTMLKFPTSLNKVNGFLFSHIYDLSNSNRAETY